MRYRKHLTGTLLLATPVVLSQLGHITVNVADSVMAGMLGTVPLAAAAFAGSTFYAVMLFGIGCSYALTPLVAATDTGKNPGKAGSLLRNGLWLYGIMGVLLAMLLYVISLFYHNMGQDEAVARTAVPYLVWLAASLIPTMFFQVFRQLLEGLSQTWQAMVITLASNLLNILLNYVLMFGEWGFPEMGLTGAGLATFLSRVVAAVLIAGYFYGSREYTAVVKAFLQVKTSLSAMKELLTLGLPSGLQLVFEVTAFGISSIMVGWISKSALAAHQIVLNVSAVTYMIFTGISAAAAIRVGIFHGEGSTEDQKKAGITSFVLTLAGAVFFGVLIYLLREFLPRLYEDDPAVISLAASIFVIVAFYQVGDGLQVVGLGALRGMKDVKIPTVVTLVSYWLIALVLGYVLSFEAGMGMKGIWIGLLTGLTVAGILHIGRFFYILKRASVD